jgi:hypothetical protein
MKLQDAHKTGRKYRIVGGGQDYFRWADHACVSLEKLFAEYEVEPEVYEVECVLTENNTQDVGCWHSLLRLIKEHNLHGKHAKLTIEVLD